MAAVVRGIGMAEQGEETPPSHSKKNKWRTPTALIVSAAWLLLAICWTFYRPSGAWAIPTMDPNAWGDWAAGTFAPLAFLWLVVGYFQQGEELRDNVRALNLQEDALRLQVQELKESVEQQTAMAKASAMQAELLEKSHSLALRAQLLPHQPLPKSFRLVGDGSAGRIALNIANDGAPATSVHISVTAVGATETLPTSCGDWLGNGHSIIVPIEFPRAALPFHASLVVRYVDELSIEQSQTLALKIFKTESGVSVVASRTRMTFNLPE
jgi:hypothetical protein